MLKTSAKIIVLIALLALVSACGPAGPTTTPVPPMTAERLVEECARAMGGIETIDSLETMRSVQHFPDHKGPIRYEIRRPNLVRLGDDLVFDGEQASWLEGKNADGTLRKAELVPEEEWKDFEVDIAWYVPAFFDYPTEYIGTETVDEIETHKLQVTLPLGAVMTYYLDAQTYLVYRATAHFTIDDQEFHPERTYSDYRLRDGILYPHAFTYEGRTGVFTATMEQLELNIPLEDERFSIPTAVPLPATPGLPAATATATPTPLPPTPVPVANQIINAETVDRLERVAAFDLPDSFVNTIVFSPDSRTLITGDRNGEVLIWERDTWEKILYLPARSNRAADDATQVGFWGTLALSPDWNVVVTAYGDDGTVTGRDREGQELFTFSYGAHVYSVAISPDGQFLAVGGVKSDIIIFDVETQQTVANLVSDHEYVCNMVFSPDNKVLLVGYERPENVMKTWDTATWQETETFTHATERIDYHDLLFSPDGQQLVIATTEDIEIRFLDLATKQVVQEFPEHSRAPYQITFSPDGSLLASASDDGTLRLWDMETGINIKTIRNRGEAGAVAFSPDGTLIAFSVWGEGVQVWAVRP